MILRGAQIQRDGHGRCGLLPNRTLPSNRAQLPPSGMLAQTRTNLQNLWFCVFTSDQEVRHMHDCRTGNRSI